jgi:hypothetical protein
VAFQRVGNLLAEDELSIDDTAASLLCTGMDALLGGLWHNHSVETLVLTPQKLAAKHPEQLYGFVADMLEAGDEHQRQEARHGSR